MIGLTYIKGKYGPVPVEFYKIIEDMINSEEVVQVNNKYFSGYKTKYLPLREPNLRVFNAAETDIIDSIINRLSGMSLQELLEYCLTNSLISDTPEREIIPYSNNKSKKNITKIKKFFKRQISI